MQETSLEPVRLRVPPMFASRDKRRPMDQTIAELMDNARRSGAGRIDVAVDAQYERCTVSDDGCGIRDPSVLLRPGASGWSEATKTGGNQGWEIADEAPAGCGMFLLAQRGIDIETRAEGHGGWKVRVDLNALGSQRLTPRRAERALVGTQVTFELERHEGLHVQAAVQRAAQYLSATVFINGEAVKRESDTAIESVARTSIDGVEIEVIRDLQLALHGRISRTASTSWRTTGGEREQQPNCSFFGRAVRLPGLPAIPDGKCIWTVRLNVHGPTPLALTWPARNELAPGAAKNELTIQCLSAVYRAAAGAESTGTFPQAAIDEAAHLGVKLDGTSAARLQLRRWIPTVAADEPQRGDFIDADSDAIVIGNDTLNYGEQQTLDAARAYGSGVVKDKATGRERTLLAADPAMEGHPEYEQLDILETISAYAIEGAKVMQIGTDSTTTGQVERIELLLHLSTADGEDSARVATHAALCWPARPGRWNDSIAVARDSRASVRDLAQRVVDAYLTGDEREESEQEVVDTMLEEAVRDIALMLSGKQGAARELIELAADGMEDLIPPGYTVVIRKAAGEPARATIEPS